MYLNLLETVNKGQQLSLLFGDSDLPLYGSGSPISRLPPTKACPLRESPNKGKVPSSTSLEAIGVSSHEAQQPNSPTKHSTFDFLVINPACGGYIITPCL